ncbi:glycosyltransferase 61 family protein [uncultured Tateyamaria sp.]|uniref:glycosyltransferase 61 family protein n=1 Tax=uncultured Tateyamaria sp. TaxID=455651 RepID=UPI002617AAE2|nr:glycosyltransferase 61 family protein [uncultured Tateyamaria sp.]
MTAGPSIVPLRDVAVTPFVYKRPLFRGGIDAAVAPAESRMKRGATLRDEPQDIPRKSGWLQGSKDLPRLKGRHVFGGPMWNHFGHFFVDCIHRLWALKAAGRTYDGIVFLAVQGLQDVRTNADLAEAKLPSFLTDLMQLLDMGDVPVTLIREATVIDRLDVPEPGTAPRNPIEPFYREYLQGYQDVLADKLALHIARAPSRIYMGRRHLLKKGGVLGCSYFEAKMKAAGVFCSTPEAMSLAVQLGHLMGAEKIVFDEGSAAHPTQILSQLDTEFLMLPRRANNAIYGQAISQRAPFKLLCPGDNIEVLPDRFGSTSSPGGMGVYVNPVPVYQRLKQHGFVTGPFDMDAFRAAEEADLAASSARTPEIAATRLAALHSIRAQQIA